MRKYFHHYLCALSVTLSTPTSVQGWTTADEPVYQRGAVAADHPLASQAGLEMLKLGGNAVDAAVATSFCLSVVRPYSCGIGGGGFMVIHDPGDDQRDPRSIAINYREVAPSAMGRDYFVRLSQAEHGDIASRFSAHASGVPGTVAGLLHALEQYGTLDRATVIAPAIRIAREGWTADADHVSAARSIAHRLEEYPHLTDAFAPLWNRVCGEGELEVGDRISNPEQAEALALIAEHGASAFYEGPIAEAIAEAMIRFGGPMTLQDLAAYRVRERAPLRVNDAIAGRDLLTMPPPSSGGVAMQQVTGILRRRLPEISPESPDDPLYAHLLAEAMKHAFADRAEWLADDAFVAVPVERLTSGAYIDELASRVRMDGVLEPFEYGDVAPAPDDGGTSHLSVIDEHGMAVACTETINLTFGSLIVVPGYGFALNNEVDDFTTIPGEPNAFGLRQSDRNLPQPGKRPLSSMSPTIVLRDGKVELVAGASGGPRIITSTLQAMLNCMLFDMQPVEAVQSPRLHHQWMPMVLRVEDAWPSSATLEVLEAMGHVVQTGNASGVVQLIRVSEDGIRAASDPRKGGEPAGW